VVFHILEPSAVESVSVLLLAMDECIVLLSALLAFKLELPIVELYIELCLATVPFSADPTALVLVRLLLSMVLLFVELPNSVEFVKVELDIVEFQLDDDVMVEFSDDVVANELWLDRVVLILLE